MLTNENELRSAILNGTFTHKMLVAYYCEQQGSAGTESGASSYDAFMESRGGLAASTPVTYEQWYNGLSLMSEREKNYACDVIDLYALGARFGVLTMEQIGKFPRPENEEQLEEQLKVLQKNGLPIDDTLLAYYRDNETGKNRRTGATSYHEFMKTRGGLVASTREIYKQWYDRLSEAQKKIYPGGVTGLYTLGERVDMLSTDKIGKVPKKVHSSVVTRKKKVRSLRKTGSRPNPALPASQRVITPTVGLIRSEVASPSTSRSGIALGNFDLGDRENFLEGAPDSQACAEWYQNALGCLVGMDQSRESAHVKGYLQHQACLESLLLSDGSSVQGGLMILEDALQRGDQNVHGRLQNILQQVRIAVDARVEAAYQNTHFWESSQQAIDAAGSYSAKKHGGAIENVSGSSHLLSHLESAARESAVGEEDCDPFWGVESSLFPELRMEQIPEFPSLPMDNGIEIFQKTPASRGGNQSR